MLSQEQVYKRPLCDHILQTTHFPLPHTHGNLYLGSLGSLNPETIATYNITIILTILDKYVYNARKIPDLIKSLNIAQHKWIDLEDDDEVDIFSIFQESFHFIQSRLEKGNVLVHCYAGVSRSPALVIYFVMRKLGLGLQMASKFVTERRYQVAPNLGFWKALQAKQLQLKTTLIASSPSVNKITDPASQYRTQKYPQKYCNHIISIKQSHEIGNLFLGQYTILKSHYLKSLHIHSILTVVDQLYYSRMKVKQIIQHQGILRHLWIDVKDQPDQDLSVWFDKTFAFIEEGLEIGNVLVHCQAGVSRSASVVIAYLMRKFKVGFDQSLNFVQSKRKVVNPNSGFKLALAAYNEFLMQT